MNSIDFCNLLCGQRMILKPLYTVLNNYKSNSLVIYFPRGMHTITIVVLSLSFPSSTVFKFHGHCNLIYTVKLDINYEEDVK